ncbi:MAG: VOC family protein [Solirubrobacterales bacterium]|nr:VOC family protein [Solirubrobacterales bacterium]
MSQVLISQLAHVELLTPRPEESLTFMRDVMGLYESERVGQSVYLRGWGDFFHHSLVLTEAPEPGLGHVGWRARGPEELQTAVERLEATGLGEGWYEDAIGHGPAYRYRGPGGHLHELFWEVERWVAPPELASPYPNRPQRFEPRGVAARQLDHVTVMTGDVMGDVAWYRDTLGFRFMESTVPDEHPDVVVFAMVTTNEKSHDLGLLVDLSDVRGRIHHLAFWVDSRDEVHRAADVLLNAGASIEFGPGRHGMGEQEYLYFREPGGVRIELNTGGYRIYQPDWEPVKWTPSQGSQTFYRNLAMPDSMLEAFPPAAAVRVPAAPEEANPWSVVSVS